MTEQYTCNEQRYSTDTGTTTGYTALVLVLEGGFSETIQQKTLKSFAEPRKNPLLSGQARSYKLL